MDNEHKEDHPSKHSEHQAHHGSHHISQPTEKSQWLKAAGIVVVVCLLVLAVYAITKQPSAPGSDSYKGEKVTVDLYVMSQCPYGVQAEEGLLPTAKQLGGALDLKINYIANDLGGGSFDSLHGPAEVQGNMAQLCVQKVKPEAHFDVIACMNQNPQAIPGNWRQCAQQFGVDTAKVDTCMTGEEGKQLLSESIVKANAAGASGSPTIFINGAEYSGGRRQSDFMRAVCAKFSDQPEACSSIPAVKPVNLIVLSDTRCQDCQAITANIVGQLDGLFGKVNVRNVDYMSEEGKQLYQETGVQVLPALLFDDTVTENEAYSNVQSYLDAAGQYKNLRIGSTFDPTKEICNNNLDDDNNGQLDCQDDYCTDQLICRQKIENQLDVFVMSQCPFGTQALNAMQDVLTQFSDVKFGVHYIAEVMTAEQYATMNPAMQSQCHQKDDGKYYCSLHGRNEVDENIRELCVMKHYPSTNEYMKYIWCRNQNIQSMEWESCASSNSMDVSKIETCSTGVEGRQLLEENSKLAASLGIGASPTWLANNQKTFSGLDAYTIKVNLCRENPTLDGCSEILSMAPPPQAQAAPSAQC